MPKSPEAASPRQTNDASLQAKHDSGIAAAPPAFASGDVYRKQAGLLELDRGGSEVFRRCLHWVWLERKAASRRRLRQSAGLWVHLSECRHDHEIGRRHFAHLCFPLDCSFIARMDRNGHFNPLIALHDVGGKSKLQKDDIFLIASGLLEFGDLLLNIPHEGKAVEFHSLANEHLYPR